MAALFEPGAGVGVEFTDNAALTKDDQVDDAITAAYVGARISESEGTLTYDATTSFNNHNYTQDTFPDQHYLNLAADVNWAMVPDRFNWTLSDYFRQQPIISTNANSPNNLEDSNAFAFGADIRLPISARQSLSLVPMFNQYYYEILRTDNRQYSLTANWLYQMYRRTETGLNLSVRRIDYTETDVLGRSPENTVFTNAAIVINGQRLRSNFTVNLGSTNVSRETGQDTTEFTGFIDWRADLSSRSQIETRISSELTDTSTVAATATGSDVQVTADVIRSSLINLVYLREDALLSTQISARYNKVKYSESPLDRVDRDISVQLSLPLTQLLTGSMYLNYNRTENIITDRLDERSTIGGSLQYRLSRKLRCLLDLKYREKESTFEPENYDEVSVFASLVYGFGDVARPTRVGGF